MDDCSLPAVTIPTRVAFSPDGTLLATSGDDGVRLWEIATEHEREFFPDAKHGRISFSPRGATLAMCSEPGTIVVRDVSMGTQRAEIKGAAGELKVLAFSPDVSRHPPPTLNHGIASQVRHFPPR